MANIENLKSYAKGESGNPNGRPRKGVSKIIMDLENVGHESISEKEILYCYRILLGMTFDEIKNIASDPELPIILTVTAKELINSKNASKQLSTILDRVIGKPSLQIQLQGDAEKPVTQEISIRIIK